MKRFHKILQTYLICGFPFTFFLFIWQHFWPTEKPYSKAFDLVTDILSWNLIVWFISLIVYFLILTFNAEIREKSMKWIANLRERDEREQQITGKAARNTYVSMLSLLIVLLFLSLFSIDCYYLPKEEQINGNTRAISIGVHLNILDQDQVHKKTIIGFNHIPLSKTGIILLILIWQIGSYNWNARKEAK